MKNGIYGKFIVIFSMFLVMGLVAFIVSISDGLLFIIVGLFFAGISSVVLSSIFYRRYVQAKVKKISIEKIKVVVNPSNYSQYYMDLSF